MVNAFHAMCGCDRLWARALERESPMDLQRYKATSPNPPLPLPVALAVTGLVIAALYFGRELFVPLALAILLSFILTPLVVLLRKFRVPRAAAVLLVVAFAFTLIGCLG